MKFLLVIFLMSFSLLTISSCSKNIIEEEDKAFSQNLNSKMDSDNLTETVLENLKTDNINKEQIFTKDYDGVVLTLTTDKSAYSRGEKINVTATLENNSGKNINLFYGATPMDWPVEFTVNIERLISEPIVGYEFGEDVVVIVPVKPGEKHTKNFIFQTYTGITEQIDSDGNVLYAPDFQKAAQPGLYNGEFSIRICPDFGSDFDYPPETITNCSLKFSVTLI